MEVDARSISGVLNIEHSLIRILFKKLVGLHLDVPHVRDNAHLPGSRWEGSDNIGIEIIGRNLSSERVGFSQKHRLPWPSDCERPKYLLIVRVQGNVIDTIFAVMLTL